MTLWFPSYQPDHFSHGFRGFYPLPRDMYTRCWTVARDAPRRVLRWDHGSLSCHLSRVLGSHPRGRVLRVSRPRCHGATVPVLCSKKTGYRDRVALSMRAGQKSLEMVGLFAGKSIYKWMRTGGTTSFGNLHVG